MQATIFKLSIIIKLLNNKLNIKLSSLPLPPTDEKVGGGDLLEGELKQGR